MIIVFFQFIGGLFAMIGVLALAYYVGFWIKKSTKKNKNSVYGYEYKKYEREILKLVVQLSECVEHQDLTDIVCRVYRALDYFENNQLTVLGRPPEVVRISIRTYAKATLDFIYESKIHTPVVEMSYSDEELEAIADFEETSDEEKEQAKQRRKNYQQRLHREAVLHMIHEKKSIDAYLDKTTRARLAQIRKMSSWRIAA